MVCKHVIGVVIFLLLTGCIQTGFKTHGIGPPVTIDRPIHSVEYYSSHDNIDVLSLNHDMSKEIQRSKATTDKANSQILSKLSPKINNQQIMSFGFNVKHFKKSKKIGTNDYILKLDDIEPIKPQEDSLLCWAACVQYLLKYKGIFMDQLSIVSEIKKYSDNPNQPANFLEMMMALKFFGLKLTPSGSGHLLKSLGANQPVLIALKTSNKDIGHVKVVVGARYSFVKSKPIVAIPGILRIQDDDSGKFAFSEFYVLDPDPNGNGFVHIERASDLENEIAFVLAFIS